jgi:hypothetical protein
LLFANPSNLVGKSNKEKLLEIARGEWVGWECKSADKCDAREGSLEGGEAERTKEGQQMRNLRGLDGQRETLALQHAATRMNEKGERPCSAQILVAKHVNCNSNSEAMRYLQVLACGCSLHHQLVGQAVLSTESSTERSEMYDVISAEYCTTFSPFSAELKRTKRSHQPQAIALITGRHPARLDAPACIADTSPILVLTRIFDGEDGNEPGNSNVMHRAVHTKRNEQHAT